MAVDDENLVKENLKNLKDQINQKETFEEAVSCIIALLVDYYPSASPSLRQSFYGIVCHVASTLQTSYTDFQFWLVGKQLFEEAERQFTDSSEREYLRTCIASASEHLRITMNQPEGSESVLNAQQPMDPVPSHPTMQVAHELLATLGVVAGSSQGMREDNNTSERASVLMDEMVNAMEEISGFQNLIATIEASLQGITAGARSPLRRPPASKQVVEKLPIVTVSKEIKEKLGNDMQCAVCRENFDISEQMHQLPCSHLFHLLCLKPWLDKHNSCPNCRFELPTDDDAYESWKRQRDYKRRDLMLQNP